MKLGQPIDLHLSKRYYEFNRQFAIRDVFDGLVELITNSDDSYGRLYRKQLRPHDGGPILIEICERHGEPSILCIRDKAEGMTLNRMREKLGDVGTRRSEEGDRGFMSRGAKDCTELGDMTFDSIVDDRYYQAKLTTKAQFIPMVDRSVDEKIRKSLHIERGNGTVVTIEMTRHSLARADKILRDLPWHFALRDIVDENSSNQVLLKDLNSEEKPVQIVYRKPEGEQIRKEKFPIAGYPAAEAHLVIWKSPVPLEDISDKFRRSGFIIKGTRAIHECSLLYPSFEKDNHAKNYFGRIDCPYIDVLMKEYDDRREKGEQHPVDNPLLVVDPNRQNALNRNHPFVKALLDYPMKCLKELLDKDAAQDKEAQRQIANDNTKNKLSELAKAATKFLIEKTEELDIPTADDEIDEKAFTKQGVIIIPTYANIAVNAIRHFGFYVNRKLYDKDVAEVSLKSDSEAIELLDPCFKISAHKKRKDVLYGRFRVKGVSLKQGICVETKCDGIPKAEALFNVVENQIEEHVFNTPLEFEHKNYSIRVGSTKTIRLFAQYPQLVNGETEINVVSSDSLNLPVKGRCVLEPVMGSNFARADITIEARRICHSTITLTSKINDVEAVTKIKIDQKEEKGSDIKIDLRDEDFGNFRAQWGDSEGKPNLLLISAKHAALKRYLGPAPDFEGQNSLHFKAILAEIVAESVCRKSLRTEAEKWSWQFRWADFKEDSLIADSVLSEFQKRMKEFLAVAHTIMIGDAELKIKV